MGLRIENLLPHCLICIKMHGTFTSTLWFPLKVTILDVNLVLKENHTSLLRIYLVSFVVFATGIELYYYYYY
jgi:hypothetical protein